MSWSAPPSPAGGHWEVSGLRSLQTAAGTDVSGLRRARAPVSLGSVLGHGCTVQLVSIGIFKPNHSPGWPYRLQARPPQMRFLVPPRPCQCLALSVSRVLAILTGSGVSHIRAYLPSVCLLWPSILQIFAY